MFNKNKMAVAVASALCISASVGASQSGLVPENIAQWAAPDEQKVIQPMQQYDWDGKTNFQVKKQNRVFTEEDGIYGKHAYIVQLEEAPISAYDGGIAGQPATRSLVQSARTQRGPLNLNQPEIASYRSHLEQSRANVLNNAMQQQGLSLQVKNAFSVALNGFTTEMTQEEAKRLAKVPGIKRITRNTIKQLHTFNSIEETGAQTVWQNATTAAGENKGEGVVIGILDTGINTDHPSFAAEGDDGYVHTNPLGSQYLGDCVEDPNLCNDKLIGVYSYPEITAAYVDPVFEESRPRNGEDYHSHGSHVAGTAAGNVLHNVPYKLTESTAQGSGMETDLVFGQVSGMAPHANVISYQVCWPGNGGDPYAGCPTITLLAAIEQAAIDNVDVINASLGGLEEDPWLDPIEQAFYNTAKSGVFIAVAAGNNGPELKTADHSSPWVTTVAAHTNQTKVDFTDKELKDLTGGDTTPPETISGRAITFDDLTGLVVNAASFINPNNTSPYVQANCDTAYPEGFFDFPDDPETALDESQQPVIVLCKRSSSPLYNKGINVAAGGAEGVIVYNQSSYYDNYTTIPDVPYTIPAIHIKNSDGLKLVNWLSSGKEHVATITGSSAVEGDLEEQYTAYFSSRGPSYFGIDTLLVDIGAPGVDIYAPGSDDQPFTSRPSTADWMSMSGTSMASPHVAGAAALLRQSHPEWSAMEIQSALLMTASNDLKNSVFLNNYKTDGFDSSLQDAGAGRMRVELADKAGLVLDESIENMDAANPNLGGYPKRLNTAYMVDNTCTEECSWVRTFTATEDGSWTASGETFIGNFEISVAPASFTVKQGEQVTLTITARHRDTASETQYIDLSGNQGQVVLTPTSGNSPVLELPVWTYNDATGLPDFVKVNAHRTSGTTPVGPLNIGEVSDFTTRSYGLVKADVTSQLVYTDTTGGDPFDDAEQVMVTLTEVPEGSKMVASHVVGENTNRAIVFMGMDSNGDGLPSWDELLCQSTTYDAANFCTINDPMGGTYWTVVSSLVNIGYGQEDEGREIQLATAIVDKDNGNLTVSAPSQVAGYEEFTLDLAYNLPEMEIGDYYFGGFDVGSNANDAGNIGFVPVIVNQVDDDVTFTASQATAKAGDTVDFSISVIANNEAQARAFTLETAFPEGIEIIPASIKPTASTPAEPMLDSNTLTLDGIQETTRDVQRNYKVTTNKNDSMCSLTAGNSPYPDYLDLRTLGWRTIEGLEGGYNQYQEFSLKELMATNQDVRIPFYNTKHFDSIKISPAGLVYWGPRRLPWNHQEFPNGNGIPMAEDMLAPLWVGDQELTRYDSTYPNHHLNAGVTQSYTYSREWLVLEWDNVERSGTPGHLVDFEMFLRTQINYEPGEYEILFAYDNLTLGDDQGSIGFKTFVDTMIVDGDIARDVSVGESYAYNDLPSKIDNGTVICMDYTGPEISQFSVNFQAYVSQKAAGAVHTIALNNGLVGSENEVLEVTLDVTGNIQLSPVDDIVLNEGESAEFTVTYADENNVSNVIELMGEGFTYEVSGHESGSTVTITAGETAAGSHAVDLAVTDSVSPNDKATQSFTLTVNKLNTAPEVMASAAGAEAGTTIKLDASGSSDKHNDPLTFSWSQTDGPSVSLTDADKAIANFTPSEAGEYSFEVTVSDGQLSSSKIVKVTVSSANTAPQVVVSVSDGKVGSAIQLDASASSDKQGDALSFSWAQTQGASVALDNANQAVASFIPEEAGSYSFEVTVSDGELSSSNVVNITVSEDDSTAEVVEPEPKKKKKSGGSTSAWMLLMLGIAGVLRRRRIFFR
ncbi:S8 family serine peptidase [Microbulbifer sp. SA54]|uniref:S8 family serine peptidase n=1 Tax=Microbulbifer sp. SA54 TaxID=3401577 RepID=UPI003AAC329D